MPQQSTPRSRHGHQAWTLDPGARPGLRRSRRIVDRADARRHDGVVSVYVNPVTETVYVDDDPSKTDPWTLARVIGQVGYRAGRPIEA